jgi:hypothetical protein
MLSIQQFFSAVSLLGIGSLFTFFTGQQRFEESACRFSALKLINGKCL